MVSHTSFYSRITRQPSRRSPAPYQQEEDRGPSKKERRAGIPVVRFPPENAEDCRARADNVPRRVSQADDSDLTTAGGCLERDRVH